MGYSVKRGSIEILRAKINSCIFDGYSRVTRLCKVVGGGGVGGCRGAR